MAGDDVEVIFSTGGGLFTAAHEVRAVDGVSVHLREGQTIGIVGESGSGKSTLGRALLRLLPSTGRIVYLGKPLDPDPALMRPMRRELQLVFQDPFGSLSPAHDHRADHHRGAPRPPAGAIRARSATAWPARRWPRSGLKPDMRNRYPHEFSGGQRQRIAIARAMILKPKVIVLDEPTSALDRSVQKQVVELLRDLQATHGLSYLFISHDLAVVRAVSDYIIVMKSGPDRRGGADRGDLRPPAARSTPGR